MPVHRIPRAHVEEDIRELERRDCERVVSRSYDGDFVIVETEFITLETRTLPPVVLP